MRERRKFNLEWPILIVILVTVLVTTAIMNARHDEDTATRIANSVDADNGDLKIDWGRYPTTDVELTDDLTITASGTYHLTGTLEDGLVTINAGDGVVRLILDNVSISNNDGPAIACYAADDLVIELVGENSLTDGETYATSYDEDVSGAIYSKADLTFQGEGELDLTANYQDGIVSKDDLKFNGGVYKITAADDGIRGKDSVYVVAGDFTIKAEGDGIKSTNEVDADKGFVLIESGKFSANVGDDGIHAYRKLVISDGEINIMQSYEGLEAQMIVISGGEIRIASTDDGINAGGGDGSSTSGQMGMLDADENCILAINGGDIYINAVGDGVDSNGWVYFNGGKVVIDGPTNNGNGALDSGLGIIMNGGEVIAVGASGMAETLGTSSNVYNVSIYLTTTQAAGTKVTIKNAADETIMEHTTAKTFNHIAAGSDGFKLGETYTLYLNDEKYTTFTISSITTVVGNGGMNRPAQPGGQNRR